MIKPIENVEAFCAKGEREASAMAITLHMHVRKLEAENRELWRMLESVKSYEDWGAPYYAQFLALLQRKPKDL